jgi:hypothetical protein
MQVTDQIFNQYIRMRDNGLDINESVRALRQSIALLGAVEREALSQRMREWENRTQAVQAQSAPAADSSAQKEKQEWIKCPDCGKKNAAQDAFCYSCGRIFDDVSSRFSTHHFTNTETFEDGYFGADSILVLTSQDEIVRFEVRPQNKDGEMIVGRSTESNTSIPDVDLISANAGQMGVSRVHAGLQYDRVNHAIQIRDLGSANGTVVNGQKLHQTDRRVLRDGDQLMLGRLSLSVQYIHAGKEIR